MELGGKTLGIIGFGRIGQALGAMAKGIGMEVIAEDIYHVPGIEEKMDIRYVELDELLQRRTSSPSIPPPSTGRSSSAPKPSPK